MDTMTTAPVTNQILRSFTADYSSEVHHALRADGQWFTRMQVKDVRYGYKLTAWRPTSIAPDHSAPTGRTARLPKEGR